MSSTTIAIRESSHKTLINLATQTGVTVAEALDRAIETYRRKVFVEAVNAGYAELRSDPRAWAEELAQRKEWDVTLMDGLDRDEHWTEDGRCTLKGSDHA